jgi:hypothetical protein
VAAAWFLVAVSDEVEPSRWQDGWQTPEQVGRLDIDRAAAIQQRFSGMPVYYPFHLPGVHFVPWDGSGDAPEEFVFAEVGTPLGDRGGRIALVDGPVRSGLYPAYSVAVWVMPGAEQDRLAAEGALLPPGFPSALPVEARVAELDAERTVVPVEAGGSAVVHVEGRHGGVGSPWPDQASAGEEGSVHLVARARDGSAGPTTASAELPGWIRPGDQFDAALRLRAVDDEGDPLPPGRYEVAVGLEQRGFGSFAPAGDEPLLVTLEVR